MSSTYADPTGILESPEVQPEHYDSSEDELKLIGELNRKFERMTQHKSQYDEEVRHNRRVLRGDMVVLRNTRTDEVIHVTLSNESRRRRYSSDNITRGINRALVGKHTRIIPMVKVTPSSADEADARTAEIATSYLEYWFRKERMKKKSVRIHRLMADSGTGVYQLCWDKDAGRDVAWCRKCHWTNEDLSLVGEECPQCQADMQMESDMMMDEAMQQYEAEVQQAAMQGMTPDMVESPVRPEMLPAPTMEQVKEGDITCRVVKPENFYPEPNIEEIEDMRYCAVRHPLPMSKICAMFPDKARYLVPEADAGDSDMSEVHFDEYAGIEREDEAWLEEWHERPSARYPDGRLIYKCNDMILNSIIDPETGEQMMLGEPSPYWMLPTLPFYPVRWERNTGFFWGESHIVQSTPQQTERDQLLRQMSRQRKMANDPPLLTPMQNQLSKSDFVSMFPGKVLKYNQAFGKPSYLVSPPFAPYTYQELDRTRAACQDKASVTDQEMGVAQGEMSGRSAAILEAQSSESISPIIVENDDAYLEMNRAVIILGQEYLSPGRVWVVHGRDRYWSYDWGSAELREGWDVSLVEVDSLSKNPALRLQQAERLLQDGFFLDPATGLNDMSRFARIAGIREANIGPDYESGERSYAAAIPDKILEGSFEGVKPWDDCKLCAQELMSWLRGPGRSKSQDEQAEVAKYWMGYTFYAQQQGTMTQMDAGLMPNQSAMNPPAGAGGEGEGPGTQQQAPAQEQKKTPQHEASSIVKQADATGEAAVRPAGAHEG